MFQKLKTTRLQKRLEQKALRNLETGVPPLLHQLVASCVHNGVFREGGAAFSPFLSFSGGGHQHNWDLATTAHFNPQYSPFQRDRHFPKFTLNEVQAQPYGTLLSPLQKFTVTYRIVLLCPAAVSFSFLPFLLLVDVVVLDLARLFALFVSLLLGLEGLLVGLVTRRNNMQCSTINSVSVHPVNCAVCSAQCAESSDKHAMCCLGSILCARSVQHYIKRTVHSVKCTGHSVLWRV